MVFVLNCPAGALSMVVRHGKLQCMTPAIKDTGAGQSIVTWHFAKGTSSVLAKHVAPSSTPGAKQSSKL
jgi:hypothetical protein